MQRRTGFTLVELLVVIALIALLAAILFPVFAQARAKARQVTCLSNLKQIGTAALLYAQDYDETFLWDPSPSSFFGREPFLPRGPQDCPDRPLPVRSYYGVPFWGDLLQPYVKSRRVFTCPDFPGYPFLDRHPGFGYALNAVLAGDVCGARALFSLKNSASEVGLFSDTECDIPWGRPLGTVDGGPAEHHWRWGERTPLLDPRRLPSFCIGRRHLGSNIFIYGDGHVRSARPRQTQEIGAWKNGYFPGAKME